MVKLKLHFAPPFNELTKTSNKEIEFEKELTLIELFDQLKGRYGKKFEELLWDKNKTSELSSFLSIIINGRSYQHKNFLQTVLKDGDDISFLYIYFGG
ncbi:MAG: MoaD/ThiS family protein [Promethearchaeota archaeon]